MNGGYIERLRTKAREAWYQGYYAGQDDIGLHNNPHPVNSAERDAWREGWFAGVRSLQD